VTVARCLPISYERYSHRETNTMAALLSAAGVAQLSTPPPPVPGPSWGGRNCSAGPSLSVDIYDITSSASAVIAWKKGKTASHCVNTRMMPA
jgi:hypothetical protein